MRVVIKDSVLELVQGDITREDTDAIVNAANTTLLGGGGVDGAIHRAGGPAILEACKKIGGCPRGEARITTGGNLKARFVIHTVGPVYRDGKQGEADILGQAYRSSLVLAQRHGLKTLAFPSISTGAYRYPLKGAAVVAIETLWNFLSGFPGGMRVRMVLFGEAALEVYTGVLKESDLSL